MSPEGIAGQLSAPLIIALLVLFYGGTLLITFTISRKKENADDYMTAGSKIGFGVSAASMTATWIWASDVRLGHRRLHLRRLRSHPLRAVGALMILFIYPFGLRIRKVAPRAHTLAEVMYARHGRSSQLI